MDADLALTELRKLAVRDALSEPIDPQALVDTALAALLADLDVVLPVPSLPVLAGLVRSELGQAPDVFRALVDELGWTEELADTTAVLWEHLRTVCVAIVEGELDPHHGASTLWSRWHDLGNPEALTVFCSLSDDLSEWTPQFTHTLKEIEQEVVAEAQALLDASWPPS